VERFEHYVTVGRRRLRCGYTTGTCAAAATLGAATLLLSGEALPAARVATPSGLDVPVELERYDAGPGWAECAVRKDAGDDPDVTDGAYVYARVSRTAAPGVAVDGGAGVGRVTRAGLDQPVGAAAINRVPRRMIEGQARAAMRAAGYEGGLSVVVSVPEGVRLAERTFNPRLGIVGGISVLGTSGIVRPMSEEALVASIELELRVQRAAGVRHLLVAPGNYGRDFAADGLGLDAAACVQCSNYVGQTIDAAAQAGFASMLVVGSLGKLVKVAAGIMNTHSRVADGRRETLAAHAALQGASRGLVGEIMRSVTTDEALPLLEREGILRETMASVTASLGAQLRRRAAGALDVEAVVFSPGWGVLGETEGAPRLVRLLRDARAAGEDKGAGEKDVRPGDASGGEAPAAGEKDVRPGAAGGGEGPRGERGEL
jgi:cobalt-precorrin-5B (C1)-methyltransferase